MRTSNRPDDAELRLDDLSAPWYKAVCHHPHCRCQTILFLRREYSGEFTFPIRHDTAWTNDEDTGIR